MMFIKRFISSYDRIENSDVDSLVSEAIIIFSANGSRIPERLSRRLIIWQQLI